LVGGWWLVVGGCKIMKYKILIFIFYYCSIFGQNSPIELKIDSITSYDSIPTERVFTINYHIENLTDNEVSFFLNPNLLISNSRASMSRCFAYTIYQNNDKIDIDAIFGNRKKVDFFERLKNAKTEEEKRILFEEHLKELNLDLESDIKNFKTDEDYLWKKQNQDLLLDLIKLSPNQKKSFSKKLLWDKKRYFKIDDVEYYLDEIIPHYFEVSISLMKDEYKDKLSVEEFNQMTNNPNFIKGWFISNKMEINFKE
jgi:hypothetical protein